MTEETRLGGGGKIILMDVLFGISVKRTAAEVLERFHDSYLDAIKPMSKAVYNHWGGHILRPKNDLATLFPNRLNEDYQKLETTDTNKWLTEFAALQRRKRRDGKEEDLSACPLQFAWNILEASRANLHWIAASQKNNKRVAIAWRWGITHRLMMGIWLKSYLAHKPVLAELRKFMLDGWSAKPCVVDGEFVDGGGVGPTEFGLDEEEEMEGGTSYLTSAVAEAHFHKQSEAFVKLFHAVKKTAGFKKPNPQKLTQRIVCSEVTDTLQHLGRVSGLPIPHKMCSDGLYYVAYAQELCPDFDP